MHMEIDTKPLTIGQVAKQAGVGVETIRFYERRGLIAEPKRRASGYRQYALDAVRRIRFIRRAKELGFTLEEISDLLSLRVHPNSKSSDVRKRAREKISDIEDKIAALGDMRDALERVASKCKGSRPTSECPILEELDRGAA
jgi:MerR family mercuric resistance operon transcriptional regulator